MSPQWKAERAIDSAAALQLIQEQFPELSVRDIRLLGAGWDNTAFIVDDHLIFRFPRRDVAITLLEAEWCALPKLASHLNLPIPVPQWKGLPTASFPWPFIGYRLIPGITACSVDLSDNERITLAQPIAKFLSILHQINSSRISSCHFPGDNQSRINGTLLTPKIKKNFEELSSLGLLENKEQLEAVVEKSQNFRAPASTCIVHGDFYVRHLLIDDKHQLAGVIDWGDIHVGDPAIDLAIAHSFLPTQAHQSFIKAYGEMTEETWVLAKMRAIYSSTYLVLYGHQSGDSCIKREALRSLRVMSSE